MWSGILLFSIPLILSNLLQILFNMSDIAVIGRFAGPAALGSVGSTTTLVMMFTGFLMGMGGGVNVLTARFFGQDHPEEIRSAVHTSFLICEREDWAKLIDKAINVNEICDLNVFGPVALEACYSPEGARWLAEMNEYVQGNYQLLLEVFRSRLPQLKVCLLEGTYLAWIDITPLGVSADELEVRLLRDAQVWINSGKMYGSEGYIRINLATQRSLLQEALERIVATLA